MAENDWDEKSAEEKLGDLNERLCVLEEKLGIKKKIRISKKEVVFLIVIIILITLYVYLMRF